MGRPVSVKRRAASLSAAGLVVAFAAFVLLDISACKHRPPKITMEFRAMGGVPIHVTAWDIDEDDLQELVEAYRSEVQRLEAQMSTYRANSAITKANTAGGEAVAVSPHMAAVVTDALLFSKETGGAFDPTVGPLVALWKEAEKNGKKPGPAAIARALQRVGVDRVALSQRDDGYRLRLEPGTALDLGGVAKGYFADVGVQWLRKNGVKRAIVELGGDLVAYDDREKKKGAAEEGGRAERGFSIGVRHPTKKGARLGVLHVDGGAVVTSGDYERGFTIAGVRYNHIVDARTGQPATGVHSVTLTAASGARADALATGVLVLGPKAGMALVERLPGVEAIIVADDPKIPGAWQILASSGIGERFERSKKP